MPRKLLPTSKEQSGATRVDAAQALQVPGCAVYEGFLSVDSRGSFRKIASPSWQESPLRGFDVQECFLNHSMQGVIRGMHLQLPPAQHSKIVACVAGSVFDVLVDLRQGSLMFGRAVTFHLEHNRPVCLLIPPGVAHGFQALEDDSLILYMTNGAHRPDLDAGVNWQSCNVPWPLPVSVISPRDRELPALLDFASPFRMDRSQQDPIG
jgi:dTDP-4-dehydrorhamnose 3,5-epimerase